jgi:hypothetical protein
MGDPVWLDTNILQFALDGDAAVNQQLATYRNAGRPLLVPPAVANELLNGNVLTMKGGKPVWQQVPSPQLKQAMKTGMDKLGVEVDWTSSKIPMSKRVEYSQIKSANIVSESDRLVLGQIKASAEARGVAKPEMITGEAATKPMMTESGKWGITSVAKAEPAAGSLPAPPRIDLAEYPPERAGAVSRFFKDRPVLKKLGLMSLNLAAQYVSAQMLAEVQDHFTGVLDDARKEFEVKYPDPAPIKARANLDRYKQAYEAALSKIKAPTGAKAAEAFALVLTPARDRERAKKYLDEQISKVKSAADGSLSGYAKVASEYIDAMATFDEQLSAMQLGIVDIADDIEHRGSVMKNTGDSLDEQYWRYMPVVVAFPFADLVWSDIHSAAEVFKNVGGSVLAFASDINVRYKTYAFMQKQLEDELLKVSNDFATYAP